MASLMIIKRSMIECLGISREVENLSESMACPWLHGTLHCTVFGAKDLVDETRKSGKAPKFIRKTVERIEDKTKVGKGSSRLYAVIGLGKTTVGKTRIVEDDPVNPEWDESFIIYCCQRTLHVGIGVKCDDLSGAHFIGRATVPAARILAGKVVEGSYHLIHEGDNKKVGEIKVKLQFFGVQCDPYWATGVGGAGDRGVSSTFFEQRPGCRITLYQDAHMLDGFLPQILMEGDQLYQAGRWWEDIFRAVANAKYLINIAGWSVKTEIRLVRDPTRSIAGSEAVTLRELLKRKADDGCKVLLLVWDDITSNQNVPICGVMNTRDEDTFSYFKHSNVECVLCPRIPDDGLSVAQEIKVASMFTHHQKTLTVDVPIEHPSSSKRRIVSFLGGIDLCDGRYDNQKHSLFTTLNSEHKDDFYNGCFKGKLLKYRSLSVRAERYRKRDKIMDHFHHRSVQIRHHIQRRAIEIADGDISEIGFDGADLDHGGPRQPWHDIHAKLEGPVAWDVLANFEQRWKKVRPDAHNLLEIAAVGDILPAGSPVTGENDPGTWNAQIFRSIDAGAASGFPTTPDGAKKAGLIAGKNQVIERSIQDAYIHAIRRAENFIYVENQYFLGSCPSWDGMQDISGQCTHLVPIELALKIVSKIEAGERFAAYIVIPMWPEGRPDSSCVQQILLWQRKTMEMMYREISQALLAKGIEDVHPRDYLSFFCLGNREMKREDEYELPLSVPEKCSHYKKAQQNRRFMIYVHSKMMIVDDEYIIVGSANINQRSMDGGRDTEIAVGAYQPFRTAANESARGQIHGFRMSLWYEHLGVLHEDFLHPHSTQCIKRVNKIAEEMWEEFIEEKCPERDLPAHLLTYPVEVSEDGVVSEREGHSCFPDSDGQIMGSEHPLFPSLLTT